MLSQRLGILLALVCCCLQLEAAPEGSHVPRHAFTRLCIHACQHGIRELGHAYITVFFSLSAADRESVRIKRMDGGFRNRYSWRYNPSRYRNSNYRYRYSCGDPGTPRNGYSWYESILAGASVVHNCRPGLKLVGAKVRVCSNGRWTPDLPKCVGKTITCTILYHTMHTMSCIIFLLRDECECTMHNVNFPLSLGPRSCGLW